MKNNEIINSRLIDLLNVMDARTMVNIFVEKEDKDEKIQESICYLKVYEFLAEPELMRKYYKYEVIGLCCGLTTNILIEEV